ncbi:MAG: hydantoinase B/oxoprolinase family protein [Actinobacteria bacterium]|nr:hydantoinase B/oxoprolinase family protein [Actinomycetota bacterium]
MKRIGVDVGGTFTDLIYVDEENGTILVEKVSSTPKDPSIAVVGGIERICEKAGTSLAEIDHVFHGTTVATNIALTHTGAEAGMITTSGFRDIIHIARHRRPLNFSLQQELPWQSRPLVKRRHRLTVEERVAVPDGEVLVPLNEREVRERARELKEAGVDAIAICLLHSYLAPEHEQRVRDIVAEEHPDAYLSVSHEVVPLYREFERFSTVCLNAYIGPKVSRYLGRLEESLAEAGFRREMQLMQSSGGMAPTGWAAERPVTLLMSGPVAGLIGGIWAAKASGYDNVVTLDIGGTSADIGVAMNGELRMRHLLDTKVGDYQAMVPMVDIDTIGAGGGSIAYVDDGGVFRVGPQSAGADPGPACYGLGGVDPTSTDAQVALGRIRPDRGLLGGTMEVDADRAKEVIGELGEKLEMSMLEAALGALQVQRFGMSQAIELNSVRRGYDPRELTLVAAGGAGPLFACEIAAEMDIPRVLVPPHPGILAANGLLATDIQHEFVATERHALDEFESARLAERFGELSQQALDQLEADNVAEDRRALRLLADGRYVGQGYEVRFQVPPLPLDATWGERAEEAFHAAHEVEYGHRFDTPVEIVNIRVVGIGRIEELKWPEAERRTDGTAPEVTVEREVVFDDGGTPRAFATKFYEREGLLAGDEIEGPAVIEQYDSTTIIPPGLVAEIDKVGNIIVDCTRGKTAGAEMADPILMRVVGGAFDSIAKEMAGVLFRMSYSSIIRESEDLGAGVFDREGNVIAESDSTPMFVGAMSKVVKNIVADIGDELNEGDIIAHNDPYKGATHSPDVSIVLPLFDDGELIGFAGASAHLLDLGGSLPGMAMNHYDIWSEANIYRNLKLFDRGVLQEDLFRHMLENTRTAKQNRGDIEAMIAACRLAGRRFKALVDRYGVEPVFKTADHWISYSDRMLRQEIAKIPDGVYETEVGWLDDDGQNRGTKLPVQVKVIVEGDEITYDLTGSSDEVMTAFNCSLEGATESALSFITRMLFLDEDTYPVFVPQTEGMFKPVKVIAPEGSIFNPRFPRSCVARFCQVQRAVDLVLRAMAPVMPEQVTAGNSAHTLFIGYAGFDQSKDEYWVYLEVNEGSYGGRPKRDGLDSVDCLIANTRNTPIEELEWRFPMRTERYELRDEPCAPGKQRGGLGIIRTNRFLADTIVSAEGERHEGDLPWGVFGGGEGLLGSLTKNPGTPGEESWPAKFEGKRIKAGDVMEIRVPSSGGYGDPFSRDPQQVLSDVLDDFTTLERAEAEYGVVIDPETMTVDEGATGHLRSERGAEIGAPS